MSFTNEELKSTFPQLWSRCTLNDARPDVARMFDAIKEVYGIEAASAIKRSGSVYLQFIKTHASEMERFLVSGEQRQEQEQSQQEEEQQDHDTALIRETKRDQEDDEDSNFITFGQNQRKEEEQQQQQQQQEAQESQQQQQQFLNTFDPSTMCSSENVEEEAEWRLKNVLETCFKTDTGQIILENDMAFLIESLEDAARVNGNTLLTGMEKMQQVQKEWFLTMKVEWESRLHSGVQAEFFSGLELWSTTLLSRKINEL